MNKFDRNIRVTAENPNSKGFDIILDFSEKRNTLFFIDTTDACIRY